MRCSQYSTGSEITDLECAGGAYIDYLYFSIETLSTAGYGEHASADPLDISSQRWSSSRDLLDVA